MTFSKSKNFSISVKDILTVCWSGYQQTHEVTNYQRKEVEKSLKCYSSKNGCFVYYCTKCKEYVFQSLGCNSRICSCCGKRYTDIWSNSLSKCMFKVPHRHFVMSVPDSLWPFLRDWNNLKVYMDSAVKALKDYLSTYFNTKIDIGAIVFLHPFGKDMKFQPHLHLLITEGCFKSNNEFVPCTYINVNGFRKTWQHNVLKNLQKSGLSNALASRMYKEYPKGFYVWLHIRGRIRNPKDIIKYVGRYVRHPAIANSRIYFFDGYIVKFFYINNEDKRIDVEMTSEQFITALIQHIPPSNFKMVRYYGAYSRRLKRGQKMLLQSSIRQSKLSDYCIEKVKYCPKCHSEMFFIWYSPKPPPKEIKTQKEITEWINLSNLN